MCLYVFLKLLFASLEFIFFFFISILRCVCAGDVENRFVCHIEVEKKLNVSSPSFSFQLDYKEENEPQKKKNQQMEKVCERLLEWYWNFFSMVNRMVLQI